MANEPSSVILRQCWLSFGSICAATTTFLSMSCVSVLMLVTALSRSPDESMLCRASVAVQSILEELYRPSNLSERVLGVGVKTSQICLHVPVDMIEEQEEQMRSPTHDEIRLVRETLYGEMSSIAVGIVYDGCPSSRSSTW